MTRRGNYICAECGYRTPKPMGRCPSCGAWESFTYEAQTEVKPGRDTHTNGIIMRLAEVGKEEISRFGSGLNEFDRVLGGGLVPGEILLLGGEPGVGKSTLLLQLAHGLISRGLSVLYVAGEESPAQIRLRAERLSVSPQLMLTRETHMSALEELLAGDRPQVLMIDSVQTIEGLGVAGSLAALRDSTQALTDLSKTYGITTFLVGHVTKEGSVAGPKVIEHIVDAILYLETAGLFRVLRSAKNRFGPVGEVGVFRMEETGLVGVDSPSEAFLAERLVGVPGSVIGLTLAGDRPMALEVQALAVRTPYPAPRRVAQGVDARRVDVVLAVLERRLEIRLGTLDVYVNLAGGMRVSDPGLDLAVAMAVYSAVMGQVVPKDMAVVGEVGLAGEIRSVEGLERRLAEGRRAGFSVFLHPGRVRSIEEAVKEVGRHAG